MTLRRRTVLGLPLLAWGANLHAEPLDAPNVVPVTDRLVTSGQPTADSLARLGAAGFGAVIYLAPSTVPNAVPDERELLERQGIEFVHVPIPFNRPEAGHFKAVTEALQRLQDRKVLVHCEVNMRASSMVFLHRVVTRKEDPAQAFAFVTRVWSPRGPWRQLIEDQLRANGIRFEMM